MKNSVSISKRGYFYYCYNEDAVLIHYLLDYKIVSGKRKIGFPIANLERVVNILEGYKINYVVLDEKNNAVKERDFRKVNLYENYYQKAVQQIRIDDRFRLLENKLKNLSEEQVWHLLEIIENEIRK